MSGDLLRVLVCSPAAAGWNEPAHADRWRELGFHHRPDFDKARESHQALVRALVQVGATPCFLPDSATQSLDAVYCHDASIITDEGAICLRMAKPQRQAEPSCHQAWYKSAGIPTVGTIEEPGTVEAGDIIWLNSTDLLVGRGYRTNESGIRQLRSMLPAQGISVVAAPLPHGNGPQTCLHLMSLISILDECTALVDLPWLAVETVQLLHGRGFRLIEIDSAERPTLACNALSLGSSTILALEENQRTNRKLQEAGFRVLTFPGSEIGINGGGGPTCLTRPLLRRTVSA